MLISEACPTGGSSRYQKNGHTRHGKQHHQCQACERPVVATADDRLMADEQRTMIEHLLRERISLRGICRAVGVSLTWLLHCMVGRFAACPDDLHVVWSKNSCGFALIVFQKPSEPFATANRTGTSVVTARSRCQKCIPLPLMGTFLMIMLDILP
jgi:hypothetical protein